MAQERQKILVIAEDDDEDFLLLERVFKKLQFNVSIVRVRDGFELLDYLRQHKESHLLVLLDLNMPRKSGREVLREVKSNDALCHIPIVVLTNSQAETDLADCYRFGANSFLRKPVEQAKFIEMMEVFRRYWLEISTLPFED